MKPLGKLLQEKGFLTEEHIHFALMEQKASRERLGETLVRLGMVTDYEVAQVLAEQAGYPFIDLRGIVPEAQALLQIPANFARERLILPIKIENDRLLVAVADPFDALSLDGLHRLSPFKPQICVAPRSEIRRVVEWYYYFLENPPEKELEAFLERLNSNPQYEAPIEEIWRHILVLAITRRATDLHLSPSDKTSRVFFRIDGLMELQFVFPHRIHSRIVGAVKVRAGMDIAEQRLPQDGRLRFEFLGEEYDLRISTVKAPYGENLVVRILPVKSTVLHLASLGFDEKEIKALEELFLKPHGIILVTGPTGSGKTTTLYSALRKIDLLHKNVLTAEDPIEYHLPLICQTQINEEIGYDFASAIRHFLRQDPDVILVGEIRDEKTASMALRAALTGHLLLSTLHANDAASSIPRLKDLGLSDSMLGTGLLGLLAQRLVRQICPYCKEEYDPPVELLKKYQLPEDRKYIHGQGCHQCRGTGYLGRAVIAEILVLSDTLRGMIAEGADPISIVEAAKKEGFRTMLESARERILRGLTTVEEINRVIG